MSCYVGVCIDFLSVWMFCVVFLICDVSGLISDVLFCVLVMIVFV